MGIETGENRRGEGGNRVSVQSIETEGDAGSMNRWASGIASFADGAAEGRRFRRAYVSTSIITVVSISKREVVVKGFFCVNCHTPTVAKTASRGAPQRGGFSRSAMHQNVILGKGAPNEKDHAGYALELSVTRH